MSVATITNMSAAPTLRTPAAMHPGMHREYE